MGTNYYLLDGTHLGKRSFSGAYCRDCNLSLVTGQPGGYDPPADPHTGQWVRLPACPSCHQRWPEIDGSTSFTFAIAPEVVNSYPPDTAVRNEYGDEEPMSDFRARILLDCFLFVDAVGREFS